MTRDELIAAMEAATGPRRELDARIAVAVGSAPAVAFRPCASPDPGTFGIGAYDCWVSPLYTDSLDAALTLVPAGWGWSADCTSPKPYFRLWLYENGPSCQDKDAEGATPAIALCIAALKARA